MTTKIKERLAEYELVMPPMHMPARIVPAGAETDDTALYALAQKKMRGGDLPIDELYFWPAEISNQSFDSYRTKMHETSLQNYAVDARAGVSFLNSHNSRELGLGASLTGTYLVDESGPKVIADFYTVRGIRLSGTAGTDDFIKGVQAGIINDVSIGFKEGDGFIEECNICARDYWDWDCRHIGGVEYDVPVDPSSDSGETKRVMAFVWVKNARLSEVSAVSDGATPNAMILTKAQREQRAGRLPADTKTMLEGAYRFTITEPKRLFNGADISDKERKNEMAGQNEETDKTRYEAAQKSFDDFLKSVRTTAADCGVAELPETAGTGEILGAMKARFTELKSLADQATGFRESVIKTAMVEGARALGKDFDEDKQRKMLDKLDIEEIQTVSSDWTARGDKDFGVGKKRISVDDADPDKEKNERGENADDADGDGNGNNERKLKRSSMIPASSYNAV